MRRSDPSKQRLWLGTGQYRRCCGNTSTNAGSDSDATSNGYSMRANNADAYTECEFASSYSYAYTYPEFTASDTDANTFFKSNADAYGEFTSSLTHADSYGHSYTQSNTKATADSTSSAVR
jgi:hypothetical protein